MFRRKLASTPESPSVLAPCSASTGAALIMSRERILAVDAARGCAMVLVCLSHIKEHFELDSPTLYWQLVVSTRLATPTFLLLSGFVIGHLLRTDSRGSVPLSLVDRGLFLLIVAHVLLGLAELPEAGVIQWLFGRAELTDAIGVALFMAVLLRTASTSTLSVLGAFMCIVSWCIAKTLTVESGWAKLAGSVLFNMHSADIPIELALVPYTGLFLIGMALSSHLQPALLARENRVIARHLLLLGAAAVLVVAVGIVAWRTAAGILPDTLRESGLASLVHQTLDPRGKRPPSPAYLLFYGGIGLLLLAMFFHGRPAWLVQPAMRWASVIGRASLLCYVVQDWLFFVLPRVLGFGGISSVHFWFGYLAVCLLALYLLAEAWHDVSGNRFLTVGLKAGRRRRLKGLPVIVTSTRPGSPLAK